MTKYALCETASDVECIRRHCETPEQQWIALSPLCAPRLQKYAMKYQPITAFADGLCLFDEVNHWSEEIQERVISQTDAWVRENHGDFSRLDLPLLKFFTYYLTILFDGVCMRLSLLSQIFSKVEASEVVLCKQDGSMPGPSSLHVPWAHDETLWADCAEHILRSRYPRINLTVLKMPASTGRPPRSPSVLARMQQRPRLYAFLRETRREGLMSAMRSLSKPKLLMLDANQWRYAIPALSRSGYHTIACPPPIAENRAYPTENHVERIGLRKHLGFMDLDLTPLVQGPLNRCISHGLSTFPHRFRIVQNRLRKITPEAVLFAMCDNADKWLWLHAARTLGCPIFGWGHGASGQASFTKQHRVELVVCDHYFTQGLGSQETYQQYREYVFAARPAGFPMLDALQAALKATSGCEKPYDFVFAPTNFYKNNFYFSFYPAFLDHQVYDAQKKIVGFLSRLHRKSLLKIGLGNPYKDYFYEAFPGQIEIESARPLTAVISQAKAFILDCPTTTLLEVLCTQQPVFVLTQFIKLNDMAASLLQKRAVCSETVDELVKALEEYCATGVYPADLTNQEYLCAYGTYKNDGKSAERGVRAVLEVISAQQEAAWKSQVRQVLSS